MSKFAKYIVGTVVTALILFLVWYFSNVVIYIIISFVFSLMGKPLMDLLCGLHYKGKYLPRWAGATTVLVVIILITFGFFNIFVPLIYNNLQFITSIHMSDLQSHIAVPIEKINLFIHEHISDTITLQSDKIIAEISSRLTVMFENTLRNLGSVIDMIVSAVVAIFSISFITFFFLKEDKLFRNGLMMMFPVKYEARISEALDSSIKLLSKYFLALIAESTIKLIVITAGLYIYGIDLSTSLIIGLISAVLNVIPYIGPLIGAIIGILIAIAAPTSLVFANLFIFLIILFVVFQLLDNVIIQPYIYSTSVKAHPLEIFLVILLAGSMAGVYGMLLAIPVYTILRVFAREFLYNFRIVQKLTEKI